MKALFIGAKFLLGWSPIGLVIDLGKADSSVVSCLEVRIE